MSRTPSPSASPLRSSSSVGAVGMSPVRRRSSGSGLYGRKRESVSFTSPRHPPVMEMSLSPEGRYARDLRLREVRVGDKQRSLYVSKFRAEHGEDALVLDVDKGTEAEVRAAAGEIKRLGDSLTGREEFKWYKVDMGRRFTRKQEAKAHVDDNTAYRKFGELSLEEREDFNVGVDLLNGSYEGIDMSPDHHHLPRGHRLLTDEEIPPSLRLFYDNRTGILQTPNDCKLLLVKAGDQIKLIFAGTEPGEVASRGRGGTVKADIMQFLGHVPDMYGDAVAITNMLMNYPPHADKSFQCVGHSLGGAMAQYAVAINMSHIRPKDRLTGLTYNTAGLSATTLATIGRDNITDAFSRIRNCRIMGDPASPGSRGGARKVLSLFGKGRTIGNMWTIEPRDTGFFGKVVSIEAHKRPALIRGVKNSLVPRTFLEPVDSLEGGGGSKLAETIEMEDMAERGGRHGGRGSVSPGRLSGVGSPGHNRLSGAGSPVHKSGRS